MGPTLPSLCTVLNAQSLQQKRWVRDDGDQERRSQFVFAESPSVALGWRAAHKITRVICNGTLLSLVY